MKKIFAALVFLLTPLLFIYGILIYCVFFYYAPRIAEEESRQEGWIQAISEFEAECRQASDAVEEKNVTLSRRKTELERTVRIEKARRALLDKGFKGQKVFPSTLEWRRKADERLAQAQKVLDNFKAQHTGGSAEKTRVTELSQQLAALRARKAEMQSLYEKRDRLMVWPLPLIAPLFEKKTK